MIFLGKLILLTAFPTTLGWLSLRLFFANRFNSLSEKLGLSFGLGLGLITLIQYLFLSTGIKITPFTLIATLLLLIIPALFYLHKLNPLSRPAAGEKERGFNFLAKVIFLLIFIQATWVFIKAFNFPIFTDDAISIWGLKAKIIYAANLSGTPLRQMAESMQRTLSGNYPLLFPLAENYINLFSGGWNDLYPMAIAPLYYISLLLAFFGILKRIISKNYAIIFTFFLCGLPFLMHIATDSIADVPFAYYYFISSGMIFLWFKMRQNDYAYLAGLFCGFGIWTKNEGYPSFLINLLIIAIFAALNFRNDPKLLFRGLLGFLAIAIPMLMMTTHYQHLTGVKEGIINSDTLLLTRLIRNYPRIPGIFYEFQRQFLGTPNKWNITGPLFLFALIVGFKKLSNYFYLSIFLAVVLNFLLYIAVYILSPQEPLSHMGTSLYRVSAHFIPLMLFFSACLIFGKAQNEGE